MVSGGDSWFIYALGGGWGHLTRAVSLARAAQPRHRVRILTNSPYARHVAKAMRELDLVALDPSLSAAAARSCAVQAIKASDPSCFIVDTFPRGLGGELPGLLGAMRALKVLVHRDLSPRYVSEAGLRIFVQSTYDLVLIPGESEAGAFADLPATVITKPWLIRDQLPNRVHDRHARILVCASGDRNELSWYGAVVACLLGFHSKADIWCVAPTCPEWCPMECWIEHWPAADLYPTADVVVGGAGYNTIYECEAYKIPLIVRAWARLYDRQWLRAMRAAKRGSVTVVETPAEAAHAAIELAQKVSLRSPVEVENGAATAVALIEQENHRWARSWRSPKVAHHDCL